MSQERTNNICKGLNNAFSTLVGRSHLSTWTLVEVLQQDQALAATHLGRMPQTRMQEIKWVGCFCKKKWTLPPQNETKLNQTLLF